ncbi:MAG: DUF4301 family protein [Bacteroidales bacterium]|nr:DUF4301 family protein [Bacteroidales bacterium]
MNFSQKEKEQINRQGLTESDVLQQIDCFVNGFDFLNLQRVATINDGIQQYTKEETENFARIYQDKIKDLSVVKFVPASGAATRMMKDLYTFLEEYKDENTTPLHSFPKVEQVINEIEHFAFYTLLQQKMKQDGIDISKCLSEKNYKIIVEYILTEKGLNYGKSPKAWILFHKYKDKYITAFEEHLIETANLGIENVEFSILKEHKEGFQNLVETIVPQYEKLFKVKYNITFSYQEHSTDTIAVDLQNNPVHDKNGDLIFRPSGHGALLTNINRLDSDIIFIKNIDNLSSLYRKETILYKQFLGGILIDTKEKIANTLQKLQKPRLSKQELVSISNTIKRQLKLSHIRNFMEFPTLAYYKRYLIELLNRPVRVCGMVKNEGEPGGGPFFVKKDGEETLQIVEKAQVNLRNENQNKIFLESTHFNPVDLVVSIKSYDGKKFRLSRFVDNQTGFISEKSFEGKTIKALEKPGLWNGSMSKWITIFVEVPSQTFSPVKTINDLLKAPHQS